MRSSLAKPADAYGRRMFTARGKRSVPLYGVMLHTTGSSLPKSVGWDAKKALKKAVDTYTRSGGPHYVIGWDGTAVATIADEYTRGAHAGFGSHQSSKSYYDRGKGAWEKYVSDEGARLWHKQWPGKGSPTDLVPNRDLNKVNSYWLGIEMIPITAGGKNYAQPAYPGSRFTAAQHTKAAALSRDIAARHGFPFGWANSPRLIGHSDINPIDRDHRDLPLWDPGYHTGLFDMGRVRGGGLWLIAGAAALMLGFYASKHIK